MLRRSRTGARGPVLIALFITAGVMASAPPAVQAGIPFPSMDFPWPNAVERTWTGGPHGLNAKSQVCIGCSTTEVPIAGRSGLDFGGAGWDVRPTAPGTVIFSGAFPAIR